MNTAKVKKQSKVTLLETITPIDPQDENSIAEILKKARDCWKQGMVVGLNMLGGELGSRYSAHPEYASSLDEWFDMCLITRDKDSGSQYTSSDIRLITSAYATRCLKAWWKDNGKQSGYIKYKKFIYFDDNGKVCNVKPYSSKDENFANKQLGEQVVRQAEHELSFSIYSDTSKKTVIVPTQSAMLDALNSYLHFIKDHPNILNLPSSEWSNYNQGFGYFYRLHKRIPNYEWNIQGRKDTSCPTVKEYFDICSKLADNPRGLLAEARAETIKHSNNRY
jgi:hypothetical protein